MIRILLLSIFLAMVAAGCTGGGQEVKPGDNGAITTVAVPFSVSAVGGQAVYAFPRKQLVSGNRANLTIKTKGLPPFYTIKLQVRGATIVSAAHRLADNTNVVLLYDESTINLGLGPDHQPLQGALDLVDIVVENTSGQDTCRIDIVNCIIKNGQRQSLIPALTRGSLIITNQNGL